MQEREIELMIGDAVQVGQHTVTVVDVDEAEVTFRVDSLETEEIAIENHQPSIRRGK